MTTANDDIKKYAKSKDVYLWKVAEKMNLQDSNFSRRLRHELPPYEKEKIMAIIDEIAERKN